MTTPAYGKIKIVKSGEDGKLLSGVVFGVYSDSACTKLVTKLTTDSNGAATTGDMELSTFYLKEISTIKHIFYLRRYILSQ